MTYGYRARYTFNLLTMERMWSPWRSQHIDQMSGAPDKVDRDAASLFARIAAENRDTENLVLWRGEHAFVLMNLYPYNNGHLMIVPYREVESYEDLIPDEQVEIAHTIARCMRWLREALNPEGFNVGINQGVAAGAGLPHHLHIHIVPRWRGDTNFMPAIGAVKVIPEALEETYGKLQVVIEKSAHE